MNLSSWLFTNRISRGLLLVVAVGITLGSLIGWVDPAHKAIGFTVGALLLVIIKSLSEMYLGAVRRDRQMSSHLSQLENETGRLGHEVAGLTHAVAAARDRTAAESRENELSIRGLDDSLSNLAKRVETLDIRTENVAAAISDLVEAQNPSRRHVLHTDARLRELGLLDALKGLTPVSRHVAHPGADQELGTNDPGSGGSIS